MRKFALLALATAAMAILMGCESSPAPKTPEARDALVEEAQAALARMSATDPDLQAFLDRSYGYAIFPSIGKGGAIVGGGYGKGVVYERGRFIGYSDMKQASIGAQIGGQTLSEILAFENQPAMERFKGRNFTFGADATATALKAGAAATAKFKDGVIAFVHSTGGLMADASLTGQQFDFRYKENVPTNGR